MKLSWIGVFGALAWMGLVGCSGQEAGGESGDAVNGTPSGNAAGADEVAAVPVDDPCDCFGDGLSRGQLRFCRESKRDVSFLEALRKCGEGEITGVSAVLKMPGDGQYTMNLDQSTIQWQGSKVGTKETGTLPFRSAVFTIKSGQLTSGEFIVEMGGLKVTSLEGLTARNLGQHLRGEDFFDVAEFPTAAYSVTSGKVGQRGSLMVDGKMNIKGISKPVSATIMFGSSDPVVASVDVVFNRADFDVRYGSGTFFDNLGDDLISDEVNLKMVLVEDVSARKTL